MKKLILTVVAALVSVASFAEPGYFSPFGDGDSIEIFKDGKSVYSYVFGLDKETDAAIDRKYADLSSERYELLKKSWYSLNDQLADKLEKRNAGENVRCVVEDQYFKVECKEDDYTYITFKQYSNYTVKTSIMFSFFCILD